MYGRVMAALVGRLEPYAKALRLMQNGIKRMPEQQRARNKHPNDADFKIYAQVHYAACIPLL